MSPDIEAANAALALDPDLLPSLGSYVRVTTPSGVYRGEVLRMERARGNDEVTWSWANGVVYSLRATPECAVLLRAGGPLAAPLAAGRHGRVLPARTVAQRPPARAARAVGRAVSWEAETDLVVVANAAIRLGGSLVPARVPRAAFRGGSKRGWVATVLGPSRTASDVEVRLQSGRMVPVPLGELRVVELPDPCPELDQWERLR